MSDALGSVFVQRALLAGLLASVACGVVGSLIVVRRSTSMAGGLSHAAFGGVGLAYLLGWPPLGGALLFALVCGWLLGEAEHRRTAALDTLVSMVWAGGMALGVLLVSLAPGRVPDLTSYLFGSILLVSEEQLWMVALLDGLALLVVWRRYAPLRALAFDEEYARASGLPVRALRHLLMALTAVAVVAVVRVVGIVLAIALLTIPAATARRWVDDLSRMMLLATALAALCTTAGLLLAYELSALFDVHLPAGPVIVLLCLALHGVDRLVPGRRAG